MLMKIRVCGFTIMQYLMYNLMPHMELRSQEYIKFTEHR